MNSVFAIHPPGLSLSPGDRRKLSASLAGVNSVFGQITGGNTALKNEYATEKQLLTQITDLEATLKSNDEAGAAQLNTLKTRLIASKREIARLESAIENDFAPHCQKLNDHGMLISARLKPWIEGVGKRWEALMGPVFTDTRGYVNVPLKDAAAFCNLSTAVVIGPRGWGRATTNIGFTFRHAIEFTETLLANRHPFPLPGLMDGVKPERVRKSGKKSNRTAVK